MARRNSKSATSTTDQTEAPAEVTNNEEAPVSESTATEAPAPEKESTESKVEKPIDLTEFKAAVAAAVEASDDTTGDVPEAPLAEVTTAYRALEGIKAKNAAKAYVNEQMADAMNSGSLPGARAHLQISEKALIAAASTGTRAERVPVDPTENFVQRVATLQLGYGLTTTHVPEGVSEDWQDKVTALVAELNDTANSYLTWATSDPETRGDEPEVTAVVRNAVKLAQGKSAKAGTSRGTGGGGGGFTGERRDIGAHIENAFADKPVGTFLTIAEIRNVPSDEYGSHQPSAGAISARLFPKSGTSTMEKVGIMPDSQGGKKGARKVEVSE